MSNIIDVDSHWTFPWEFRVAEGPLKRFKDALPDEDGMIDFFMADDLLRTLSGAERPTTEQIFPSHPYAQGGTTHVPEYFDGVRTVSKLSDRLKWMDQIGIRYSIVNSGGFPAAFPLIKDLKERHAYLRTCNDILAAEISSVPDRLGAVAYADLSDLDWAIEELTRMRALGSRAFGIRGEPVDGRSLGHPHFDRLWSAITDLGMIVNLHTGFAPALFGEWGHLGLDMTTEDGRGRFLRLANSQRHQAVELFLNAMVFGGAFQRHPKLTVLVAELSVFWLPSLVSRMDMNGFSNPLTGPWDDELSPGDLLRRQVRVSPLPGFSDSAALNILQGLPTMLSWCSDYPHAEGNADPIAFYGEELQNLDENLRKGFLGGNITESFKRTGDPIDLVA